MSDQDKEELAPLLSGIEKGDPLDKSSGNQPKMITLDNIQDVPEEIRDEVEKQIKDGKYCATFFYWDIGLPCLRTYGERSKCVQASGWGYVYFINYEVFCAGTMLTVCYEQRGPCA